jgi:hypothetical protein
MDCIGSSKAKRNDGEMELVKVAKNKSSSKRVARIIRPSYKRRNKKWSFSRPVIVELLHTKNGASPDL